ncbi:hypothetical protein HFP57_12755 [Parasphingopyxis algicola]|uniref:hypothetical protein n=1 Tax=Parasphingopyxis algicola TaxID=2026624 RepID=UPI0015A280E6|nr:hypothetical protein [Parasphingopyxis algicola]QLC25803.1 hypothetical protein HFP57_12755 [Parasphingopyxis algicola]
MAKDADLIGLIYDLVLDPGRFPELVDSLGEGGGPSPGEREGIGRHIRRACAMFDQLQRDESRGGLAVLLAHEQQPSFLVSRDGLVITANELALAAYGAGPGDRLTDLLAPYEAAETLADVLHRLAMAGSRGQEAEILKLEENGCGKPLLLSLTPVETKEAATVILVRTPALVWSDTLRQGLARIFTLTEAELAVLEALMLGHDPTRISVLRDTHISTIRAQLRSLYMKTGTKGQTELMQAVFGLSRLVSASFPAGAKVGRTSGPEAGADSIAAPVSERRYPTPDLDWFERGSPDGAPVLTMHDELIGDAFLLALARSPLGADLRYIVPVRSGYGAVAEIADETVRTRALTASCAELVAGRCSGEPATILAHGNGFYFAAYFAWQHPDLVRRIVAISPMTPIRNDDDLDGMPRYNGFVSAAARKDGKLLEFILRAGFSLYGRIGPKRFAKMVFSHPDDRRLLDRPDIVDCLAQGAELVGRRHHGLLEDEKSVRGDWSAMLAECGCPTRFLVGESDTSRRCRVERSAARMKDACVTIVPGAGQLLAFGAPDSVLAALGEGQSDGRADAPNASRLPSRRSVP